MRKNVTNSEIIYAIIRLKEYAYFWDILTSLSGSLHISFLYKHSEKVIKLFEQLTDVHYSVAYIDKNDTMPELGIIVVTGNNITKQTEINKRLRKVEKKLRKYKRI